MWKVSPHTGGHVLTSSKPTEEGYGSNAGEWTHNAEDRGS